MTDKTKNQLQTIVIAAVMSLLGGGGGSYAVNNNLVERITKVESAVAQVKEEKAAVEKDRDELKQQLADVLKEVKEGQLYLRDTVMPAITDVKTDVAVLKSRR
jgi:peptidoglycan hydrolase CwlO-like protein